MSHTPGPWFHHYVAWVGEQGEGGDYNGAFGITNRSELDYESSGERGDLVAYVPWDGDHLANARLIAAAPELLVACQMRVALEDGDVHEADTRWKQARKVMREAIAKAKGGE